MSSEPEESDRLPGWPHPRETLELAGHEVAERAFLDAVGQGRLHHAWLIGGPEGVGKATLAYRIARFLLSGGGVTLDVPAHDPAARRIAAQAHPDLLVLRRPWDDKAKRLKSVLTVDEVRRLAGFFGRHAGAGGWRVVIVDTVDHMNASAANALLKLLEEPPQRALLLLVSHAPARLLPTIRSRCRTLILRPLPADDLVEVIGRHLDEPQEEADRLLLAYLANGSIGRALQLASQDGVALYRDLSAMFADLPALDVDALHKLAGRFGPGADGERAFRVMTELFGDAVKSVIHLKSGDAAAPPGTAGDALMRAAERGQLDRWLSAWDKMTTVFRDTLALNLDRRQAFLTACFHVQSAAESP